MEVWRMVEERGWRLRRLVEEMGLCLEEGEDEEAVVDERGGGRAEKGKGAGSSGEREMSRQQWRKKVETTAIGRRSWARVWRRRRRRGAEGEVVEEEGGSSGGWRRRGIKEEGVRGNNAWVEELGSGLMRRKSRAEGQCEGRGRRRWRLGGERVRRRKLVEDGDGGCSWQGRGRDRKGEGGRGGRCQRGQGRRRGSWREGRGRRSQMGRGKGAGEGGGGRGGRGWRIRWRRW